MHYGRQSVHVAVMTDSSYVHSGLQGNAMRWRANGCVSAQGLVTNVDLWIDLMQVLDVSLAQFHWVQVPSYTDIAGNAGMHPKVGKSKSLDIDPISTWRSGISGVANGVLGTPLTFLGVPPAQDKCIDAAPGAPTVHCIRNSCSTHSLVVPFPLLLSQTGAGALGVHSRTVLKLLSAYGAPLCHFAPSGPCLSHTF